jgi:large subunit ribosomal protein L4
MILPILDSQGQSQGEYELRFALIPDGRGTQAVHDVVIAHHAAQRMGTACTKTMGEVAGSGRKPWRQKGTGRARAGSFASPLWRGGGVVFGPKPRDYTRKVSKATRRLALRKALGERLKAGDVLLVDDFKVAAPKTRELNALLGRLQATGTTLIVTSGVDRNLTLSARNLPHVELCTSDNLNTYEVLRFDKLIFTRNAFETVDQRLAE